MNVLLSCYFLAAMFNMKEFLRIFSFPFAAGQKKGSLVGCLSALVFSQMNYFR